MEITIKGLPDSATSKGNNQSSSTSTSSKPNSRRVSVFDEVCLSQEELLNLSKDHHQEDEEEECSLKYTSTHQQHLKNVNNLLNDDILGGGGGGGNSADRNGNDGATTRFPSDFSFDSPHKATQQLPWQNDIIMNARSSTTLSSANVTANPSPIYTSLTSSSSSVANIIRSTGVTPSSSSLNAIVTAASLDPPLDPLATETIATVCYREAWEASQSAAAIVPSLQPPAIAPPPPLAPPTTIGIDSSVSCKDLDQMDELGGGLSYDYSRLSSSYNNDQHIHHHQQQPQYHPHPWDANMHYHSQQQHPADRSAPSSASHHHVNSSFYDCAAQNPPPFYSSSTLMPSGSIMPMYHYSAPQQDSVTTTTIHSPADFDVQAEVRISDLSVDPIPPPQPAESKEYADQAPISDHTYSVAIAAAAAAFTQFEEERARTYHPSDYGMQPTYADYDPDACFMFEGENGFPATYDVYGENDMSASYSMSCANPGPQAYPPGRKKKNKPKKSLGGSNAANKVASVDGGDGLSRKKRVQVKTACGMCIYDKTFFNIMDPVHCRKSSKKCSEHRPCDRCMMNNLECIDAGGRKAVKGEDDIFESHHHHLHDHPSLAIPESAPKPPTAPKNKRKKPNKEAVAAAAAAAAAVAAEEEGIMQWINTAEDLIQSPPPKKKRGRKKKVIVDPVPADELFPVNKRTDPQSFAYPTTTILAQNGQFTAESNP